MRGFSRRTVLGPKMRVILVLRVFVCSRRRFIRCFTGEWRGLVIFLTRGVVSHGYFVMENNIVFYLKRMSLQGINSI